MRFVLALCVCGVFFVCVCVFEHVFYVVDSHNRVFTFVLCYKRARTILTGIDSVVFICVRQRKLVMDKTKECT